MTAGRRGDARIGSIHQLDSTGPYLMCSDKDVSGCLFNFWRERRIQDYVTFCSQTRAGRVFSFGFENWILLFVSLTKRVACKVCVYILCACIKTFFILIKLELIVVVYL